MSENCFFGGGGTHTFGVSSIVNVSSVRVKEKNKRKTEFFSIPLSRNVFSLDGWLRMGPLLCRNPLTTAYEYFISR